MGKRRTKKRQPRKRRKSRKRRGRKKRGGNKTIPVPANIAVLEQILIEGGIPKSKIVTWPKSLNKLLKEMRNSETILVEDQGKIKRIVDTVGVKIYNDETKGYTLYEIGHYNQDTDGLPHQETKSRNNMGVLEKIMGNENPQAAMKRGITEELGQIYSDNIRYLKGQPVLNIEKAEIKEADSNSYPGLPAQYKWYWDEIFIPKLTEDTFYHHPKKFFTREIDDDGRFKRWILWEWKQN